jgi:hypothetical protein
VSRASSRKGTAPPLLREALPGFYQELVDAVEREAVPAVVAQLSDLRLDSRCGCGGPDCATFYVTGGNSPLTEAEKENRGPYHRETILLDAPEGHVALNLDHLDRVTSVEILNRPDLRGELDQLVWLRPRSESALP